MSAAPALPYSLLDLAPIRAGSTAAESFRDSLDLARHAEAHGYRRFWLAEHHNIPGVASAATAVLIAHVAAGTRTIRVGAGGIMLPNHAPLVIAEQFGTLASLHPGRIDLGLGRAPGGDLATARALRRYLEGADRFPADLAELRSYFRPAAPGQRVRAIPGAGLDVPIYLLGSSDFSARLAAREGLPFAFASHFAPNDLEAALALYRAEFTPSAQLSAPYAIVAVNAFAADTDAEARRLKTSLDQAFLAIFRGAPAELAPPVDSMEGRWNPQEERLVARSTRVALVGARDTIRAQLDLILATTRADELILAGQIFDQEARKRSFAIAAEVIAAATPLRSRT